MAAGFMVRQYTLTLDGTTQSLAAAFTDKTVGGTEDISVQQIMLQPDAANAGIIRVGDSTTDGTHFGFILPVPVGGVAPVPQSLGPYASARIKPSPIFVRGTNNDVLHFLLIGF